MGSIGMENIIKAAVERGASDLHIKAGDVFRARIDGALKPLTKQRLTPEQTKAIALQLMPSEEDRKRIESIRDYDCSRSRCRPSNGSVCRTRSGPSPRPSGA